jgi:hypothetical protein
MHYHFGISSTIPVEWCTISGPISCVNYNPDWAIFLSDEKNDETLFLE